MHSHVLLSLIQISSQGQYIFPTLNRVCGLFDRLPDFYIIIVVVIRIETMMKPRNNYYSFAINNRVVIIIR